MAIKGVSFLEKMKRNEKQETQIAKQKRETETRNGNENIMPLLGNLEGE